MEERDQDLLKKMQLSHESFYNNQYDRDSQFLTLIKERDSDQEAKTKSKSRDSNSSICQYSRTSRRR